MEKEHKIVQIRQVRNGWFSATDGELFTIEGQDQAWVKQEVEYELQRRKDNGKSGKLFDIKDENAQKTD